MSQAEISASSPLPVTVLNSDNEGSLPKDFRPNTKWTVVSVIGSPQASVTILEVQGAWIRCDAVGGFEHKGVWLHPASMTAYAWKAAD